MEKFLSPAVLNSASDTPTGVSNYHAKKRSFKWKLLKWINCFLSLLLSYYHNVVVGTSMCVCLHTVTVRSADRRCHGVRQQRSVKTIPEEKETAENNSSARPVIEVWSWRRRASSYRRAQSLTLVEVPGIKSAAEISPGSHFIRKVWK